MRLHCKNCYTEQECLYRSSDEKVVCTECGNIIEVSPFMLRVMKSDKSQHIDDTLLPFQVVCNHCRQKLSASLDNEGRCTCPHCNKTVQLSTYMIAALETASRKQAPEPQQTDINSDPLPISRDGGING